MNHLKDYNYMAQHTPNEKDLSLRPHDMLDMTTIALTLSLELIKPNYEFISYVPNCMFITFYVLNSLYPKYHYLFVRKALNKKVLKQQNVWLI